MPISGGASVNSIRAAYVPSMVLCLLSIALCGSAHAQASVASTSSTATPTPPLNVLAPEAPEAPEAANFDAFLDEVPAASRPFREQAQFVEGIEVLGNKKTARSTILRRLSVRVGELFDDDAVEASRLRLLGTGFFSSVEFSLRRGSQRGRVLLVVEVKERNTILIDELFFGTSAVSRVFGGLGLAETNFLGRGVTVGAAFVIGEGRRAGRLRLFVPSVANTPLQLSGSALISRGEELVAENAPTVPPLVINRRGGTVGFGLGVGASQRVSLTYRLESLKVDRLENVSPAILRQAPSILFDESVVSTLRASYERDTRDDPFVPRAGNRLAISVELGSALLGSSYEYSKYVAEMQQAFALFGTHSLSLTARGGVIQGRAPFLDQFLVGDYAYFAFGRNTLPRAVGLNFASYNDYDDLLLSGGAEYAIPILEREELLYRMYAFAGIDVSVTASLEELQEDLTGRGPGKFVPLSFDAGVKLDTFVGSFTVSLAYFANLLW